MALQRVPSDLRCYLLLAQLESIAQYQKPAAEYDFSAALDYLLKGLEQLPDSNQPAAPLEIELRLSLVETMLKAGWWKEDPEGKIPDSKQHGQQLQNGYTALKERNAPQERIDFLKALELTYRGRWHEAEVAWDALQQSFVGDPQISLKINLLQSACYQFIGDFTRQLNALQRAKKLSPLSFDVRLALARTLAQLGRPQEAFEELKQTDFGVPDVARMLGQLHIQSQLMLPTNQRSWERTFNTLDQILENLKKIDRQYSSEWTSLKIRVKYAARGWSVPGMVRCGMPSPSTSR
jgi:tetratricopeptide (TPR) repeat protein